MKLWLFEDTDPTRMVYGRYATFVIVAESKKDAKEIAKRGVEDLPRQDVRDFKIREIDLATERAGVLSSEFIGT